MSEERRICAAKPIKPVACSFGFETQPFEFAARPADDIEVNPLQGRTQLRSVEVAVVVDPASNARVVHLGQIWQGFVAAMMKRPAPDRSANSLLKNLEIGALAVFLPRVLGRSGCCEQTLTYAVSSLGMRIRL